MRVPTGSKLLAQIHGGSGMPHLAIDDAASDFQAVDKHNFRAEAVLTKGQSLSVSQGGSTLGRWPIEIIPDRPPAAAFSAPPKPTAHAALRLDYQASDDYGVEAVKAVIRRADGKSSETIEIALPLPGLHLKDLRDTSYQDLSPNPWAGLPVEIRIVATDALGQTGESEPVKMNLPEREFHNPVARAIIDQRRELAKDPASRDAVAEILGDLNSRPQLYPDDTVVYMALGLAALRLRELDVGRVDRRGHSAALGHRAAHRGSWLVARRTRAAAVAAGIAERARAQCAGSGDRPPDARAAAGARPLFAGSRRGDAAQPEPGGTAGSTRRGCSPAATCSA